MAYKVTTVFNIPIYVEWSLLLLLLMMISSFGDPILGLSVGLGVALSIVLHELGHSLVAQAFGCKVRDITLMMLGGCATIINMPRKAWQEFLMAAAGPLVSLLLGVGGLVLSGALHDGAGMNNLLFILGVINIGLFLFNLLPAFPMDGGRILRAFLQHFFMSRLRATWVASRIGRIIAVLMGVTVLYSFLSGNLRGYMFIRLLIALYIYRAAGNEYLMVLNEERRHPGGGRGDAAGYSRGGDIHEPPLDDGKAVVSPPPYAGGRGVRVDVERD